MKARRAVWRSRGRCAPRAAVAAEETRASTTPSRRASSWGWPTSWSSRVDTPRPRSWRACRSRSTTPSAFADDAHINAQLFSQLAGILNLQRKADEAIAVYARDRQGDRDGSRAAAGVRTQRRVASIRSMLRSDRGRHRCGRTAREEADRRVGEQHFDTAAARGTLAIGLMRAGTDADASANSGRRFRS